MNFNIGIFSEKNQKEVTMNNPGKNLLKDLLISKLVPLFRDSEIDIDEAVEGAKNQLAQEAKKAAERENLERLSFKAAKRENLERLFNSRIQTIKDRGCPGQIVEMLQDQKSSVLQKAMGMSFFDERNFFFIPVIPLTCIRLCDLMTMVHKKDKQGYTNLNPTAITDEFETPKDPYYIYDVEDGRMRLDESPMKAIGNIKEISRSPLTAAEVVALATHTNVLSRHYVNASGSRYGGSAKVPLLLLDGNLRPMLSWILLSSSDCYWGSASCVCR